LSASKIECTEIYDTLLSTYTNNSSTAIGSAKIFLLLSPFYRENFF